jgi:hypothetical protein
VIVPHVNPDGEVRNASWSETTLPAVDHRGRTDRVFDLALYLRHVVRERPGDDLEFGFPYSADDRGARPESRRRPVSGDGPATSLPTTTLGTASATACPKRARSPVRWRARCGFTSWPAPS